MLLREDTKTGSGPWALFSWFHRNRFVFLAFLISFVAVLEISMVVIVSVVLCWALFSVFLPARVKMTAALSSSGIAGTPLTAFQTVFFLSAILSGLVILILWVGRKDLRTTGPGSSSGTDN